MLLKQASDTNLVYTFLLTDNGVYGPYIQGFVGDAAHFGLGDYGGQSMFSRDGTKYVSTIKSFGKVFVADFDRCSGALSNSKVFTVPPVEYVPGYFDATTSGVCFSPNGNYLYVVGNQYVQQCDLSNPTLPGSWTILSLADTTNNFQLYSTIYPGPDGKLYIGNWSNLGAQMSVIDSPDQKGNAASFCRKCLRFPGHIRDTTFNYAGVGAPPCMPNYALGPTNPVCYPTGITREASPNSALRIFPNPTYSTVVVNSNEAGEFFLYDVMGREVSKVSIDVIGADIKLHLRDLPYGAYHYRFQSWKGSVMTGRLILLDRN